MKPLVEDTYQLRILRKISLHELTPDFPKLQDYGIDKSTMEDYLSDKQDILDIPGSQTHRMTVLAGIVLVFTLIASAFDHLDTIFGSNASLVGLAFGLVVAFCWWGITALRVKNKLQSLYDEDIENYLSAVDNY